MARVRVAPVRAIANVRARGTTPWKTPRTRRKRRTRRSFGFLGAARHKEWATLGNRTTRNADGTHAAAIPLLRVLRFLRVLGVFSGRRSRERVETQDQATPRPRPSDTGGMRRDRVGVPWRVSVDPSSILHHRRPARVVIGIALI